MDLREVVAFGFREFVVDEYVLSLEESRQGIPVMDFPLGYYKRYTFAFPNGYGASVIRTPFSYGHKWGQWECAVIVDGRVDYTTEITSDVLGYLPPQEVHDILKKIKELKPIKENT